MLNVRRIKTEIHILIEYFDSVAKAQNQTQFLMLVDPRNGKRTVVSIL